MASEPIVNRNDKIQEIRRSRAAARHHHDYPVELKPLAEAKDNENDKRELSTGPRDIPMVSNVYL